MDYFQSEPSYDNLSLLDLLEARDQFHVHLMHKTNVVGTAIGRYLIRNSDPLPWEKPIADGPKKPKEPRTLENSGVRDYSWPCVLVFVSKWLDDSQFGEEDFSPAEFIPKTIYLQNKAVPVCVVLAPMVETEPDPIDPLTIEYPDTQLSGGYPISVDVQKVQHIASIGCLLTDGHSVYALTNRHVAGAPDTEISSVLNGNSITIGKTTEKQLGRLSFGQAYKGWPGEQVCVNVDVGLIAVEDLTKWSPSIFNVGMLGPLQDLDINNITTSLIGCPVRAYGCASGKLSGRIAALFYRYKSVGGMEYVADFLIGSRDEQPLLTRPGDSGTVWVVERDETGSDLRPVAVQWGGAVFSGNTTGFPFALATNLSTVCRELDVDIFRSSSVASFEYWGAVGHYTIGAFACDLIQDPRLKTLMLANRNRISFDPGNLNTKVNDVKTPGFVQLADVPDKVWKNPRPPATPYGRKGLENPNHYADMDYAPPGHQSLDHLTKTAADLDPAKWRAYYHAVGWNSVSQRGLLPFRVWQIYKKMVEFVSNKDIPSFVAAAGILAHYVGDGCQPLHGSMYDDGDPFRNPDGTPSSTFLKHGTAWAHGVHAAYETDMLDTNVSTLLKDLNKGLPKNHGMPAIHGGRDAGFSVVELMRRTKTYLPPKSIVDEYAAILHASKKKQAPTILWQKFEIGTVKAIVDGIKTLAMLWDSAWSEGSGSSVPGSKLKNYLPHQLQTIYEDEKFLPSVALGQIDQYL